MVLEQRVELMCEYDEADDVLYAWVGEKPVPAITYETDAGHLVRLDPHTNEFVGVTIFEYRKRWKDRPITLDWEIEVERAVPWIRSLARKRRERVAQRRSLLPA